MEFLKRTPRDVKTKQNKKMSVFSKDRESSHRELMSQGLFLPENKIYMSINNFSFFSSPNHSFGKMR